MIEIRAHAGHLCAYVSVPEGHPWHGKTAGDVVRRLPVEPTVDDVGVLNCMCFGHEVTDTHAPLGLVARCWQGVTFAGPGTDLREPLVGATWWLGFDAAHDVDTDHPKDEMFMREKAAMLASDIAAAETVALWSDEVTPLSRITEATRGILAAVDVPADWTVTVTFPADSDIGRLVSDVCRRGGCNWTHTPDAIVDVSPYKTEPEVTLRRTVSLDEARRTLAGCDYEAGEVLRGAYP